MLHSAAYTVIVKIFMTLIFEIKNDLFIFDIKNDLFTFEFKNDLFIFNTKMI